MMQPYRFLNNLFLLGVVVNFLSIEFALIFPLFFIVYWALRPFLTAQKLLLLVASYALLASFSTYFAAIIMEYTIVTFALGQRIFKSTHEKKQKRWLRIAVIYAIAHLALFKYFDFFHDSVQNTLQAMGLSVLLPSMQIIIPLGISFYTFHSISYLVSIYKKRLTPARYTDYALFLSFFPSVVAGPINRAEAFLPQIQTKEKRTPLEFNRALVLMVMALAKVYWLSAVLANTWADPVFSNPSEYHSLDALLGLYAYALQLYLNFSGYTDLVTAIALLLGFKLPINFNAPYLALNLKEFWQRWHISLSTWIRDYVYIPLGGSRGGFTRTQINLILAMLASGLWHGSSYTFLIWGAIHGVGVALLNIGSRLFGDKAITQFSPRLANFITLQYVCLAWIFFRSPTLEGSWDYINTLFGQFNTPLQFNSPVYLLGFALWFVFYPRLSRIPDILHKCFESLHWSVRPWVVATILWVIIQLAPAGIPNFIYASF